MKSNTIKINKKSFSNPDDVIKISKESEVEIKTPNPNEAIFKIYEDASNYYLSRNESSLAKEILKQKNNIFDIDLICPRLTLPQAPIIPTILKDVFAIPPQCVLNLKKDMSLEKSLIQIKPRLKPGKISKNDCLDYLISIHNEKMKDEEGAIVFVSGGWDSRIEISLINKALNKNAKLVLVHILHNNEEAYVSKELAKFFDAKLIILEENDLEKVGQILKSQIDKEASKESNWRPTIYRYAAAARIAKDLYPDYKFFGYTPYQLKCRDYNVPILGNVPLEGRARAVTYKENITEKFLNSNFDENRSISLQDFTFKSFMSPSSSWDKFSRRDWLNWTTTYGVSYSRRTSLIPEVKVDSIFASGKVVEKFMGLEGKDKFDETFIEYSLGKINPKILDIPILSSTGGHSFLADKVSKENINTNKIAKKFFLNNFIEQMDTTNLKITGDDKLIYDALISQKKYADMDMLENINQIIQFTDRL